ncbi:Translin-1 [Diplodia intermedia]|uniref:Translin-1 n=1 Tax=Diplodia intermedia TaxID=856260 RepID=A0ABR3TWD6_9PEZI
MTERQGMVDPAIFEQLQARVDQDSSVREAVLLSRSSPVLTQLPPLSEIEATQKLAEAASKHPYYKFNGIWSRQVQDTIFTILYGGYLGGFVSEGSDTKPGRLLTIEEVGGIMNGVLLHMNATKVLSTDLSVVPVNLKDKDAFHITIEEYLQALISLIEELARLARNSVTLGDYTRPMQISQFIKDVHAGFQILNLKNDSLRRRSDAIKYKVKEVEDVVYDLSLRNLVPSGSS